MEPMDNNIAGWLLKSCLRIMANELEKIEKQNGSTPYYQQRFLLMKMFQIG